MTTSSTTETSHLAHLGHLAEQHVARHGDYRFLFFDGVWHTSGELLARSRRVAAGLLTRGLTAGHRVVATMPNTPEVPMLYNAIWRAGGVVTPAMFLLSAAELRHVIEDSGARFVITNLEVVDRVHEAVQGLDPVPEIVCVEGAPETVPLADLEAAEPGAIAPRAADDLAALLYTGGTTGRAKGVMLSHANLTSVADVFSEYEVGLQLERELLALPLSHAFGLIATIAMQANQARKVWIMPRRFVPDTVVRLIEDHRPDVMQVVPSMLQMLLTEPLEQFDLSSLRFVFSGGASLAPEVLEEFQRRVPSASILEGYGLTENSTLATATPVEAAKVGSVGTALPRVEIKIVDSDGREVPRGEPGEILTRSPAVMMGYWNDPQATAAALKDGWLATGDIGSMDEDGYISILDRKKDLIIRGGFNVFPRDIEDALLEHPAIHMAAVVGRPDPVHGEEVVAFIALKEGVHVTPDELMEWSRHRLGAHKRPREIHLLDAIPLTDVGKVNRKALRAELSGVSTSAE